MKAIHRTLLAASAVLAGTLAASAGQSTPPGAAAPQTTPPQPAPAQATPQTAPAQAAPPQTASSTAAPGAAPSSPADDKNLAVYMRVCSLCHDAQRILSNRRTRDQWGEVIDKMVERGAQGSDDDFNAVLEYLVGHYGRINVNRGAVKDLETVLKLSDAEAEAIVAYRKDHGPIQDFDTLSQVPGLDAQKLSQKRDAISY
ncbi:MAG: helix-hairpin-helix domain-containing protein [Acidobacteriota bacterium]